MFRESEPVVMSASPTVHYVIDRALVEEEIARSRSTLARGRSRWFALSFLRAAALFYVIAAAAQWSNFADLQAVPPSKRLGLLLFPALAALFVTIMSGRSRFSEQALDPDYKVREISESLRSLGGAGWAWRSLRTGVFLGASIGIPVGLLLALDWRPEHFPVANRWMVLPSFVGVTLMWTIPFAFLLRWLSLLGLRRFVKTVPGPKP